MLTCHRGDSTLESLHCFSCRTSSADEVFPFRIKARSIAFTPLEPLSLVHTVSSLEVTPSSAKFISSPNSAKRCYALLSACPFFGNHSVLRHVNLFSQPREPLPRHPVARCRLCEGAKLIEIGGGFDGTRKVTAVSMCRRRQMGRT